MRIINTKFIFKLVLLFFILLFLTSKPVKAGVISEEIITIDDFDLEDSGKILKTQGYDNIDYKYILKKLRDGDVLLVLKEIGRTAYEKTIGDVSLIEKTLVNLLLITIIASFFTNFANVQRTTRKKIPFGVAQVGKSFRNEITPGKFIFRVREFEQMELEFFCAPGTDLEWHAYWKEYCMNFLLNLGIRKENLRFRDHSPEELAFYSNATADIEFVFPFGWGELWGIADRTDYDLKQHMEHSGESMEYMDPITNEKYVPYCIEPSLGADRVALAFLVEAYDEEELEGGDTRVVMHLHPALAPIKAAILPLSKKLDEGATAVYEQLSKKFNCEYDNAGSIGKRYRRQDEIGTPYCITYDFESAEDNSVTVRDRDTMEQQRIKIDELEKFLEEKLEF